MAKKFKHKQSLDAQDSLFDENELDQNADTQKEAGPVTVLGMTFATDDERRAYFREQLRAKLPELRNIEGFPIGSDDDIVNISDPPYYTACPNPWLNDFIAEWEQEKLQLEAEGKRISNFEVIEPYAADVSEGKNNPIYAAHSYHTKVPHPAIMKLLYHYTQPGDIVYDGFAGTGMTGVACGLCETAEGIDSKTGIQLGARHCICGDLSPIASFIAYNLNINSSNKLKSFKSVLLRLRDEYSYLYTTNHGVKGEGEIRYVVWSDVIECPNCGNTLTFWNAFVEYGKGNIKDSSHCPNCNHELLRKSCQKVFETYFDERLDTTQERVRQIPVIVAYSFKGKRYVKEPDGFDIELIEKISCLPNNSWYPVDELGDGDKMGDPKAKGIYHVHQFYFPRTLFLLSKIWEACSAENWFYVTNAISRNLTKLNRFIVNSYNPHGRINGPLAGTLYVPSEIVEQNVFDLLLDKISEIEKYRFQNVIQVADALNVPILKDSSIDYIFTDPPFGANIMYSELNFISESWLRLKTNTVDEAIQNKTQNKDVLDYGSLMQNAFSLNISQHG